MPSCTAEPEIVSAPQRLLVGIHCRMSLSEDQTHRLWRSFMPRLTEVADRLGEHVLDVKIYAEDLDYSRFDAGVEFEKWAAAEVRAIGPLPEGMDNCVIAAGQFAVFPHFGPAMRFPETLAYFHRHWLPASGYALRTAPHFEILQPGYDPVAEDAREEVWVPVVPTASATENNSVQARGHEHDS